MTVGNRHKLTSNEFKTPNAIKNAIAFEKESVDPIKSGNAPIIVVKEVTRILFILLRILKIIRFCVDWAIYIALLTVIPERIIIPTISPNSKGL